MQSPRQNVTRWPPLYISMPQPEPRLMGWSGRAPALPAIKAGKGRPRQGVRHVLDRSNCRLRDRYRYWQELVPHRWPRCAWCHCAAPEVVARSDGGPIRQPAAVLPRVIEDLAGDWRRLDERIEGLSAEIGVLACADSGCERLMSVPGIGPIISSAMVAAIGTGDAFTKGRDFAAWLGLVPRQMSTGDRTFLGKISKRGNRYLRVLFVQAAWVVLIKPKSWERHGSSPGSRRPRNGCTTTCWQLHSLTSSRA
jgi:transposase